MLFLAMSSASVFVSGGMVLPLFLSVGVDDEADRGRPLFVVLEQIRMTRLVTRLVLVTLLICLMS